MDNLNGINMSPKQLNKVKGNIGESLAVNYLKKSKYVVLENNYKTNIGEIDIIAKDKENRIIFVEVKSKSTLKHGYPREMVTRQKQQKIKLVSEQYLRHKKIINSYIRFDVIEILGDNITHITNAF